MHQLDQIRKKLKNGLDYAAFYRLLAPLVASISEGHTTIKFPGRKIMGDDSQLFPFSASCDFKTKSITLNEYSGKKSPIPNNSQLVALNGIPAEKIIGKIVANTSGESEAYRLKMGTDFYFFGMILKTYYDFNGNFNVRYKSEGRIQTKTIAPVRFRDFIAFAKSKKKPTGPASPAPSDYSLTMMPEIRTAILTVNLFDDPEKFDDFLKKAFDTIGKAGTKNLILDLRANGGGNSVLGDHLLQYIADKPFTQFAKTTVKFSQLQKGHYERNCREDSTYCPTYAYIAKQENGKIATLESPEPVNPYTGESHFQGKIYLLTSLRTFSSAATFAQCFKSYGMGTIIGEETGGWLVSYGDKISTKLPFTEMPLTISTKKFYAIGATDKDLHGVVPDLHADADKAMESLLKKIGSQ